MNRYTLELQEALKDGEITSGEVQAILRAYNSDIKWNNSIIEKFFWEHGHTVHLNRGYNQGLLKFTQSSLRATKQQENEVERRIRGKLSLNNRTRQKLAWLSIVGPAALISLFRLLQVM